MSYRIWNTTKKENARQAKDRIGHVLHVNDQFVHPGRSLLITEEQFSKWSTRLITLQAEGKIRIEPMSNVTKEQRQDLDQQISYERKMAEERAKEKAREEAKKPNEEFDPNNYDEDLPFAEPVTDSITVRAPKPNNRKNRNAPVVQDGV